MRGTHDPAVERAPWGEQFTPELKPGGLPSWFHKVTMRVTELSDGLILSPSQDEGRTPMLFQYRGETT